MLMNYYETPVMGVMLFILNFWRASYLRRGLEVPKYPVAVHINTCESTPITFHAFQTEMKKRSRKFSLCRSQLVLRRSILHFQWIEKDYPFILQ